MSRNFKIDWVLTKKLAIGSAPNSQFAFELLKKEGIKSILTLCDEDEFQLPLELNCDFFCERYVLPDHKKGKLPQLEDLRIALQKLENLQLNNPPTFVHCIASMERSPLVCLAWLVKDLGYSPEVALQYLMEAHPGTNPLQGQLDLLNKI